jgi:nucleotide-binding universal stress UspA family protein
MTIKRILVPVDFSTTSLQALDYAIDFSRSFGAEMVVVSVIEPFYSAMPTDLYGPAANTAMLLDSQRQAAREEMIRLEGTLRKRRVPFRTTVQVGVPFQVIVDEAKRRKVDLIVMSTHGRTGLSHALLGSVAEKVVRTAECPVLTIRGTKRRER